MEENFSDINALIECKNKSDTPEVNMTKAVPNHIQELQKY